MSLDLNTTRLYNAINQAVANAVTAEAARMAADAKQFAPVRKVFSSKMLGKMTRTRRRRQIVGISTAQLNSEVEIRSRLGLGPKVPGIIGHELNVAKRLSPSGDYSGYRQVTRRTLASEMLDASWYSTLSAQKRRSSRSGKRLADLAEADLRLIGPRRTPSGEPVLQKSAYRFLTARGRYELRNADKRQSISETVSFEHDAHGVMKAVERRLGGRLRSEIVATHLEVNGTTFTARVISPTPYAKYVEFGTHHAPAQPYMRPAANIARRRFRQTLQRTLDETKRTHRRSSR